MRRLIILLAVLATSGAALAQTSSGLVRRYPFDRSGPGSSNLCDTSIGCPTVGTFFQQTVGATLTPEYGAAYVLTVNGNPTRVSGAVWPAGPSGTQGYAWRLDGTGDYLSIADAAAFETQDFSLFACFVPRAGYAANDTMIAKYRAANISYILYTSNGTAVVFDLSDDGSAAGGHYSTLTKAAVLALHRLTCVTVAYDFVADGSSVATIWVDEQSAATASNFNGPAFNGDADFTIGATHGGGYDETVDLYVAARYPGVLVAADHLRLSRRARGLYDNSASNTITVGTGSGQAAVMVAPLQYVLPPDSTTMLTVPASGVSGIVAENARTNLAQRGAVETCTGAALTGWAYSICSNGTGTVTCACDTTQSVFGSASFKGMKTVNGNGSITLYSACIDIDPTKDYYLKTHVYGSSVDEYGAWGLATWTDNACSAGEGSSWKATGVNFPAGWTKYDAEYDSAGWGTTESVMVKMSLIGATGADQAFAYLDGVEFYQGNRDTYGLCVADTDAAATCTYTRPEIENGPWESTAAGSWTFEYNLICPYALSEIEDYPAVHYYAIYTEAVAPGNHGILDNQFDVDGAVMSLRGVTYDSGGVDSYQIWGAGLPDFAKDVQQAVRFSHSSQGYLGLRVGTTEYSSVLYAGTGLLYVLGDLRLGWGGTNANGCALGDLRFYRRALGTPRVP